jgi:hypothetical protein
MKGGLRIERLVEPHLPRDTGGHGVPGLLYVRSAKV